MNKPDPGHGYVICERLGEGAWKEAYRAVVRGEWHDRALLRYMKEGTSAEQFVHDVAPLLRLSTMKPPPANIATFYEVFVGRDGKAYIAEELLYQPLDRIAPLAAAERFLRIARDLATGLSVLHSMNSVHRDLKLDNCGVDFSDRAKIFDLGAVTSEGGPAGATILSRAPELVRGHTNSHTWHCDVWALGAVLFALRDGGYPFVSRDEVKNRPKDKKERGDFDETVKRRYLSPDSEKNLLSRVARIFPSGPADVISRMLAFRPENRLTAEGIAHEFEELIRSWLGLAAPVVHESPDLIQELESYFTSILEGQTGLSTRQWTRAASVVEKLEHEAERSKVERLLKLANEVKAKRLKGELRQ